MTAVSTSLSSLHDFGWNYNNGISAEVIKDSVSLESGKRLISWEVKAHRWILAEVNTHKVFSRSARSSRAVPFRKMLQEIRDNPAMPVDWRKNQPGMVAGELMTYDEAVDARDRWLKAAECYAIIAEYVSETGLHKQWVNRLLEPFMWYHGVITATDLNNFWHLRRAPDAQPEFKVLADSMWNAMQCSKPIELDYGQWHLPYVYPQDVAEVKKRMLDDHDQALCMISAARVARVSYKPHDSSQVNIDKDLALAYRLLRDGHMSPFEHQATPDKKNRNIITRFFGKKWRNPELHGNFTGFIQHRKLIPGEVIPG